MGLDISVVAALSRTDVRIDGHCHCDGIGECESRVARLAPVGCKGDTVAIEGEVRERGVEAADGFHLFGREIGLEPAQFPADHL